jgi:hypothetical protein
MAPVLRVYFLVSSTITVFTKTLITFSKLNGINSNQKQWKAYSMYYYIIIKIHLFPDCTWSYKACKQEGKLSKPQNNRLKQCKYDIKIFLMLSNAFSSFYIPL